jgi:SWI/SNF-related matrix-associated actin-dependent regulator of chromatin subfamily A3
MGMGKSLSMLALIVRTLDVAYAWAMETNASSQGAQGAWALKGRSKATLIVASSDREYLTTRF